MPEGFKPVLRREMEVYAGFMEYTDHHVGRLVDSLTSLGIADNTLIYYIAGDNGASAEGIAQRLLQRDELFQRSPGARDAGVPHRPDRQARRARVVQPLRRRLGSCDEHAVPVDQAGRIALGRDTQRHRRPLAEGHQGEGRESARSSATSSTSPRRFSKRRGSPNRSR